jgi:hypothetical protein
MNRNTLYNIFKTPYQSIIWKGFLKELFRDISSSYFETPIDLKDETLVKHKDVEHIWEFGDITLSDGRIIKFYEVELKENQEVTKNRVSLRNIISGEIGFGYIDGAIVTYYNKKASDWRFTFISKSLYWDTNNNEVKTETHPKRYTYLLGQNENVKTALNQFECLFKQIKTRGIDLEGLLKAFSVEKLSKEFYDGYFQQYETFVGYIVDNPKAFNHFLNQISSSNSTEDKHKKAEHLVSDFVKKLLGRIVFLFFLQKKGWMGVPLDENWGNGQLDFIFRLFEEFPDKNDFYKNALAPLFFRTLNVDRSANNDIFSVTNTRIPYLNGGLFEKDKTEPENIQFEPQRFIDLLAFFSQYNFTVDESSPDDQDIGVDPEMLGYIFENLLEDNKDKGAFYTPKEIVHYMTQESLIEYLQTHLKNTSKEDLTIFVKQKRQGKLNENDLEEINSLLNKLKILDPAIGSGAFPMGLLHEIFALKGLIAFEQGYEAWSPARVKERIIENSIYGVDIEEGAVDIARLRFWLSLIVDEPTPRPLPNLDYKIICGNSLISRYSLDTPIKEVFKEFNKERSEEEKVDLGKYKELVNDYMHEANHDKKEKFKQLIEDVKNAFKTFFTGKELKTLRDKQGELHLYDSNNLFGNNKSTAEKERIKKLKTEIVKLEKEKKEREEAKLFQNAIEWRFEFPNLLEADGNFGGFDIVIGNPPYISANNLKRQLGKTNYEHLKSLFTTSKGTIDIYILFFELSIKLLKDNGVLTFITPNRYLSVSYGKALREYFYVNTNIQSIADFSSVKVFRNASTYPIVTILQKNINKQDSDIVIRKYKNLREQPHKWLAPANDLTLLPDYLWGFLINDKIETVKKILKQSVRFENAGKINATSTAKEADQIHELINDTNGLKLINTGTIDRYSNTWGKEKLTDKGERYLTPRIDIKSPIVSSNRTALYGSAKLIIAKIALRAEVFYDKDGDFASINTNCIHSFNKEFLPEYILAWLNSKLYNYMFECFFDGLRMSGGFLLFSAPNIRNTYIKQADKDVQQTFKILSDYISAIFSFNSSINDYVPNQHIIETFDEVLDAMFYELFFKSEFEQTGIFFTKYARRDFQSIEGKSPKEQKEIIHNAYQKLREKENEIRNNLKEMKIELRDLLMPIITV